MSRDFTPESQRIFENIMKYDNLRRGINTEPTGSEDSDPPSPPSRRSKAEKDLDSLRMELVKIICNSTMVVEDCDEMISGLDTMEDYIKSDAKVAKSIHSNMIDRLVRVLKGESAFDDESHLVLKLKNIS